MQLELTVHLHAQMRARFEAPTLVLSIPAQCSDEMILSAVAEQHPQLSELVDSTRVAVDDEYVRGVLELSEKSRVDLIPPVSGGT